jgi:hypothetical protein
MNQQKQEQQNQLQADHTSNPNIWPTDAVYCVEFSLSTRRRKIHYRLFFNNADSLSDWYSWQGCLDKSFELQCLWMWDCGPLIVEDVAPHIFDTHH